MLHGVGGMSRGPFLRARAIYVGRPLARSRPPRFALERRSSLGRIAPHQAPVYRHFAKPRRSFCREPARPPRFIQPRSHERSATVTGRLVNANHAEKTSEVRGWQNDLRGFFTGVGVISAASPGAGHRFTIQLRNLGGLSRMLRMVCGLIGAKSRAEVKSPRHQWCAPGCSGHAALSAFCGIINVGATVHRTADKAVRGVMVPRKMPSLHYARCPRVFFSHGPFATASGPPSGKFAALWHTQ
jgi:hypothetical protein